MRRWPDSLPTPSYPGFGLAPVDQVVRSDMETGFARTRQVSFAEDDLVEMAWVFTDQEMGSFRLFESSAYVSAAGDSDDIRSWDMSDVTATLASTAGPDECIPTRLSETATTGAHHINRDLPELTEADADAVIYATIDGAGRDYAKVEFLDQLGDAHSATVNLITGSVTTAGAATATTEDRGNGYWRVRLVVNTGFGPYTPAMRVWCMAGATTASYAGDTSKGLRVCEVMARIKSGADLFVRSGADGKALGAGGAAWITLPLALGGGFAWVEARFKGRFKGQAGNGLEWRVTASMEVRHA